MAMKLGIQPGEVVLDVGCGVGGPAREMAIFTDCNVVGLNNNDYQYPSPILFPETNFPESSVPGTIPPNVVYPNMSHSSKAIS